MICPPNGLQFNGRTSPFIYNLRKKRINKKDVICYINERNENEIIYWER